MLDDLYSQFEDTLNACLEDTDALIEDMIETINTNSSSVAETLKSETAKVGTELSSNMESIWQKEDQALRTYLDEDSLIGGFKLEANGYFDQMLNAETGITTALGGIAGDINSIMEYASQIAKSEEESDYNKNQMIQNSAEWWGATDEQRENLSKENAIWGGSLNYHIGEDGKWYDNDGDVAYEDSISTSVKLKALLSRILQNNLDSQVSDLNDVKKLDESTIERMQNIDDLLGQRYSAKEKDEIVKTLVGIMSENGLAWASSSTSAQSTLTGMNYYIAGLIQEVTGKKLSQKNGAWTINGENLFDKYGYSTRDVDINSRLSEIGSIIDTIRQNGLNWHKVTTDNEKSSLASANVEKKAKLGELIGDEYSDAERDKIAKVIVGKMEQNQSDMAVSDDIGKTVLESQNEYLAEVLSDLLKSWIKKDSDGVWKIGNEELFKKYASGGLADYTGLAWLDGTPSKPEMVLSAQDTENFIDLKDYLAMATEQGLFKDPVGIPEFSTPLTRFPEIKQTNRDVSVTNHFNIAIDHVEDYNDFVNQLRKDRQFEKMIQAMSVDLLAGKSSLAKNKYKW